MSFLIIDGERYGLQLGENTLGGEGDGELPMPELAALPRFAVVCVWPDRPATIQRLAPHLPVFVDGCELGDEPRELRHGSRIEVARRRILHGDLRTLGSTAHVAGVTDEDLALLAVLSRPEPTADTGGRLVALANGAVYPVPEAGLEIGRDPACGVVLSSKAVSRRHAVIAPSLMGYTLTDLSANGVSVNGARVEGAHVLGQGDVIHIGPDGFRFEANSASFEPSASALRAPRVPLVSPDRPTPPTAPAVVRPAAAPPRRAVLEIRTPGCLSGARFGVERSPVSVGRGEGNDIVLPFESVSGSHATLEWRGGAWVIADLDSTNGTYVGGVRITGEHRLDGPIDVSFGGVEARFEPAPGASAARGPVGGGAPSEAGGTRRIVGVSSAELRKRRAGRP